jgi:ParB family chromosome partitioning protein
MSLSHPALKQVSPNILTPHPLNASIYGQNEDVSSMVELIQDSGWVKPLVVTTDYVIVSGHRRWKAVKQLRWETVPVEVRHFPDSVAVLEALLLENASRDRTLEVRIREGMAWEKVEKEKARLRKGTRTDLTNIPENFPGCSLLGKFGDCRDAIGKRIGLSGRSYSKGRKVIEILESEEGRGNLSSACVLRSALSKSIDAAYKLATRPPSTREAIANLIEKGNACNVTTAIRLLRDQSTLKPSTTIQSCWNCQHRGEFTDNQSIYCNKFGFLNLIYKSGDERGQECEQWRDRSKPPEPRVALTFLLELHLPIEWQSRLEEAVAAEHCEDAASWITYLIGERLFQSSDLHQEADGFDNKTKQGDEARNSNGSNGNGKHSEKNQVPTLDAAVAPALSLVNPPDATICDSMCCHQATCCEQPFRGGQN